MLSLISQNLKKFCVLVTLLFPLSLSAESEKEKLVDEFIMESHGALTPEAFEGLLKSMPNPFQNQFAEEQEKFNKIYEKHSPRLAQAMQKHQLTMMQKILKPVYLTHYSEEELKGIMALNKLPVNEKMKKISPELMGASAAITQKFMQMFMGVGLVKTMRLSLAEARQKGLNKETLDKADAVLKQNDINVEEAAKEFTTATKTISVSSDNSPKQKLIDQLLGSQLLEQLKPIFGMMKQAIPNKFETFFGADQAKFNEIFEKHRDQIVNEFSKSFMDKMKELTGSLYTKHFNEQELEELVKIQNNPLTKKQMDVAMKMAQMGPEFAKAQQEMQNQPIVDIYIEILEEAKKQGLKSSKIDEILNEMKAAKK
jgi:uncharacterized protein YdbL (DUF1318 family)